MSLGVPIGTAGSAVIFAGLGAEQDAGQQQRQDEDHSRGTWTDRNTSISSSRRMGWLPAWLDKLLPDLGVEGEGLTRRLEEQRRVLVEA